MKFNCEITEITHEELVNFLSTATYGDNTFDVEVPEQFEDLTHKGEGDCWEDHLANVLLNGGHIDVYDTESYDEDVDSLEDADDYGTECPREWSNDAKEVVYHLSLDVLKKSIARIFANDEKYLMQNFTNIFTEDGDGDFYDAWNLLQNAIFDEVIYG